MNLPPIIIAIFIQGVVFAFLFTTLPILETQYQYAIPVFAKMVLQGGLAAGASFLFRQSYWWAIIQFIFPFVLWQSMSLDIPVWIYPIIIVFLLGIFWNVIVGRVPLYLTNTTTSDAIAKLIPKKEGVMFVDLGSGLASTLRALSKQRPDVQFHGYETAPGPYVLSRILVLLSGQKNIHIHFTSFWKIDLGQYDFVYCFLSPVPMAELYDKASEELSQGSLLVSNSFKVPNHKPARTVTVKDGRQTKLLIWRF